MIRTIEIAVDSARAKRVTTDCEPIGLIDGRPFWRRRSSQKDVVLSEYG